MYILGYPVFHDMNISLENAPTMSARLAYRPNGKDSPEQTINQFLTWDTCQMIMNLCVTSIDDM